MKPKRCSCGEKPEVMAGGTERDYGICVYCPACKCEGKSIYPELPIAIFDMIEFLRGYGRLRAIREWNYGHRKPAEGEIK